MYTNQGSGFDEKPEPNIPDFSKLTPQQAWNAAIDEVGRIVGWSTFWDDGRSIDEFMDEMRINTEEKN